MKIYTKTGDTGTTGLIGGTRVSKADPRIQVIGEIDEANANIGVAIAKLEEAVAFDDLVGVLKGVQGSLFELGAEMASTDGRYATLSEGTSLELEASIDELTAKLPLLTHFILPGGSKAASELHRCRSVVRRVERALLDFESTNSSEIRQEVKVFINRLSDWLFVAARTANIRQDVLEVVWHPARQKSL